MNVTTITDLSLLENIALGLLMAGPKHGYNLYRDFEDTFGLVWQAGRSKFYARLNELAERGYLAAEMEPQEGRPPRKVYHVTAVGREAFEKWLSEPIEIPRHIRVMVPVKLRFFRVLGLDGAEDFIDAQSAACQGRLDRESDRLEAWEEAGQDELFADLLYELRRRQLEAMIDWLAYCKDRIQTQP